MYKFKKFEERGAKISNYTISVNKSKTFGFNSGFYKKEEINRYKKVVLFYDEANKAIAFHFTNDEDADSAFTTIHGNAGRTGSVSAHSFFMTHDLTQKKYLGKKIPKKIKTQDYGTLFVIDL